MQRSRYAVVLVLVVFFVISLLTNVLGALVPIIIEDFSLSLTMAGLLPFSFFIAYGILSIPAGTLIERRGERVVMTGAFVAACMGSMAFGLFPEYRVAIGSLFLIGAGMAVLQVAVNPLLRVAGGEEHFAFFSVLGQMAFSAAWWLSPRMYSWLVLHLSARPSDGILAHTLARVVPPSLPWVSVYWVFAALTVVMVVVVASSRLPKVERKQDERAGTASAYTALLRRKEVWLYFLAIFAYVGSEQGINNWLSEFLRRYHGYDPNTVGAGAVSNFGFLMGAGCLLGLVLLKLLDSRIVLRGFTVISFVTLAAALFGPGELARYAFPALGFCFSVMWSIVFSLALNSVDAHHGAFAGILCTGITGGAVVPFVIGSLGDLLGLRLGMLFLYLTLGYILSVGFWARPLIRNETIWDKRRLRKASGA